MITRFFVTGMLMLATALPGATFFVTATSDSGPGSLRQALIDANNTPGTDTVAFNIPGEGVRIIALNLALPQINEAVTIDGATQPGYSGEPLIALDGSNAGPNAFGLLIVANQCTVRGLAIHGFSRDGVRIEGRSHCVIQGNYLGVDTSGNSAPGMGQNGLGIYEGSNNLIGGMASAERNLIGGCAFSGIILWGSQSVSNRILGNWIGIGKNGTNRLGNIENGVVLSNAPNNQIGSGAGGGNVISGNFQSGVFLLGGGASNNVVAGNFIGTDPLGRMVLTNAEDGITILLAGGNLIGGAVAGARNLISGNAKQGVYIGGTNATGNVVAGNFIGTDSTGTIRLPNGAGIGIENAPGNLVGGTEPGARNLISGNREQGIYILELTSVFNRIEGNYIGSDVSGTKALANDRHGIFLSAPSNHIGGAAGGAGNLISGNGMDGISIGDPLRPGNVVQGNFIGTQADGLSPLGNALHGVVIEYDCSFNVIGGLNPGEGNRIAFSRIEGYDGVRIHHNSVGNLVRGNAIFGNAGLGIDLGTNNVTLNDVGDEDDGPNRQQNFPVLASASGRFRTSITGSLNSQPGQTYQLDFYINTLVEANGHGEGQRWLGALAVTTDGAGNAVFTATFTNTIAAAGVISAAATDIEGNTSEFSAFVTNQLPASADADADGLPDDYETAWGLDPSVASDASADADGDGVSNLAEYQAGTNPRLAGDALRFLGPPQTTDSGLLLRFQPVPGRLHRIEHAERVIGPWQILATNLPGFACPVRVMDAGSSSNRFYRLFAQ